MKIYTVWYKYSIDTEDRIRGATTDENHAKRMAYMLQFLLKHKGMPPADIGIKTYVIGNLTAEDDYVDRIKIFGAEK